MTTAQPTLVLSSRYTVDSSSLWRAALAMGWDVERIRHPRALDWLEERTLVLYGDTLLADQLIERHGVTLLEPSADWLPSLPFQYRLRCVELSTLGAARYLRHPAFVKPVDEKWFAARVYSYGDDVAPAVADDLPVLVSEPVRFTVEVRAFILDRRVAALSAYIRGGVLACTPDGEWPLSSEEETEARAFLSSMLGDPAVTMPAAVVVDVGYIEGRGWAVVEANPAWASGLCGCSAVDVLPVLRRATVGSGEVREEDGQWGRHR